MGGYAESKYNIYFTFDSLRKSVKERNVNNEFHIFIYFINVNNNAKHNIMFLTYTQQIQNVIIIDLSLLACTRGVILNLFLYLQYNTKINTIILW